jgi:hypothetical protein
MRRCHGAAALSIQDDAEKQLARRFIHLPRKRVRTMHFAERNERLTCMVRSDDIEGNRKDGSEASSASSRRRSRPSRISRAGLRTHAMIGGRAEPLIRFEGHYFDRRLSGTKREEARRAEGLSSPTAGAIANPASQVVTLVAPGARCPAIDRAGRLRIRIMGDRPGHGCALGVAGLRDRRGAGRCRHAAASTGSCNLMARYILTRPALSTRLRNRGLGKLRARLQRPRLSQATDTTRKLAQGLCPL